MLMKSKTFQHWNAFEKRNDLKDKYKSNAYPLWVLGLYIDDADIDALASRSLTDGSQDKSIDFLEVDQDNSKIIIGQGYFTEKSSDKAKSGKADSLNTGVSWLLSGDLSSLSISSKLKIRIEECRQSIENGDISCLEILYIHNLPENNHSEEALKTCAETAQKILANKNIIVSHKEIGLIVAEEIYQKIHSEIVIEEKIYIDGRKMGSAIKNKDWDASLFTVKGTWLRDLYIKYGDSLFSANYRGFLGANKKKRINNGIQQTINNQPEDFWVFNNGITLITNYIGTESSRSFIKGISIINGAQTTGSIGSLEIKDDYLRQKIKNLEVMCRIVVCKNQEKITEIVKFNNTQNKITTWDQFSNDPHQKLLKEQFFELNIKYNFKRNFENNSKDLSIEQVVQPILSFNGLIEDANKSKNSIFENNEIFKRSFEKRNARHIALAYAFYLSIDKYKNHLDQKPDRTSPEEFQLKLFNHLSFKNFLMACIGSKVELFIGGKHYASQLMLNNNIKIIDFEIIIPKIESITKTTLRSLAPILEKIDNNTITKYNLSKFLRKSTSLKEISYDLDTSIATTLDFIPTESKNLFKEIIYSE